MSKIKTFRADAEFNGKEFEFDKAKLNVLKEFDKWREESNVNILATNFGRKHGIYIEDSPHYWYIEVLYEEIEVVEEASE